jgi:Holliday junction DNA helicase RuvA
MIGRLIGKIVEKNPDGVLLEVNGVGFEVALPLGALAAHPPTGETLSLHIHTHVREDELRLFGFVSKQDRVAFRTMLKVSGVGPKLALTVIGALSGDQLAAVIQNSDAKRLSSIPGIGKKTAERIILELSGKLKLIEQGDIEKGGVLNELSTALKNLGFRTSEVERALAEIKHLNDDEQPFEALLRNALGLLQGK